MFSLSDKQETNRGFGESMSRAFEFAATPVVFGALGYAIDRGLGTGVVFTIGLATFAFVGMFVRLWYGYDQEMREHEANAPWARRSVPTEDTAAEPVDLWQQRGGAGG